MTSATERPTRKEPKEKPRPQLPEGRSDASIRLTDKWEAADLRHDESVWRSFCTTLTRGRDLLSLGYSISDPVFLTDKATSDNIVRFRVYRPAKKVEASGIEYHSVDVVLSVDPDTGESVLIYECDTNCIQYGNTEHCLHTEATALMVEGYIRLLRHLGIVSASVLPIAAIASQYEATASKCYECNGEGWVYDSFCGTRTGRKTPCPSCQVQEFDPPAFHHDDYVPYANALADFGD